MELPPELISLSTKLATIAGRRSVEAIFDKINAVKQKGNQDEIINNLEEIINELISDKNQLIQISQAYEEQLITQKMSDNEIDYITTSIVPIIEEVLSKSEGNDAEKMQSGLEIIKPILSKETFNIMQILGFNFKHAVGQPLTELLAASIKSNIPHSSGQLAEYQLLTKQAELELMKICNDEEAFKRFIELSQV